MPVQSGTRFERFAAAARHRLLFIACDAADRFTANTANAMTIPILMTTAPCR